MLKFEFEQMREPRQYLYASYVPSSVSPFRVHRYIGAAKQSFYNRAGSYRYNDPSYSAGKILEMVDGVWYVLYDVPGGTKRSDLPWSKDVDIYPWRGDGSSVRRAVPMSKAEYAEWRIAVDREARGYKLFDMNGAS